MATVRLAPELGRYLNLNERFQAVRFVNEGMEVIAPARDETGKESGIRCRVSVASGYHARVVNEKFGVDGWIHIDDLRREVG